MSGLAALVGISAQSVRDYESGRAAPAEPTLRQMAEYLRFPVDFFGAPEQDFPSEAATSFRALARMTAAQSDGARASGALAFDLSDWLDRIFDLPEPRLPDLRDMPPEEAAAAAREYFGIGEQPIQSVVHLLERNGVRVFSLAESCRELDAFSLWRNTRPFCFLNTTKSVEHGRFDAAHELGHLVLHKHGSPSGRKAEQEADAFGSAFLMPRSSVRARVPHDASMSDLIALKSNWNVSLAALAHRSHKVGKLSDWTYRGMCIEMQRQGYRTREPAPLVSRETSQVLNKVFSALRDRGTTKSDVARELRIYLDDLDAIVFGLIVTSIDGGGGGVPGRPASMPPLRLVT
jgi:Zn-dependent peptidase ImmA (M78 family)/DNA-binding XRE family transcriptional regulator